MIRASRVVLLAIGLSLIVAQSVAAYGINGGDARGDYGQFLETKDPDVVCLYDESTSNLSRIKVHPPRLSGTYGQPTWVGWRYEIRAAVAFHRGDLLYRSPVWKDQASLTVPSEFARSIWRTSSDVSPTSMYYVRYIFFWYAPPSKTEVEGKVIATPSGSGFRMTMGTQHTDSVTGCSYEYATA